MNIDQKLFRGSDGEDSAQAGIRSRGLGFGLVVLAVLVTATFLTAYWNVRQKRAELEIAAGKRIEVLAATKAETVSQWIKDTTAKADRLIRSDLFRLYAAEVDLIDEDISLLIAPAEDPDDSEVGRLAEQLPLMVNMLDEFAVNTGFSSGRIVNRSGQVYISTDPVNTAPVRKVQMTYIQRTLSSPQPYYSPVRLGQGGLEMDFYLPIFPPKAGTSPDKAVAVLMLTRSVSAKISDFLSGSSLSMEGDRVRLIQHGPDGYEEIVPWLPRGLRSIKTELPLNEYRKLPFGRYPSPSGEGEVLAVGMKVPELDWWILQESSEAGALQNLVGYARTSYIMAALASLAICLLFGALWWRTVGESNRRVADQLRERARQIEQQRSLLDGINAATTDFVALKDLRGKFYYVNPAFAEAVGRDRDNVAGLDEAAIFGFDQSKRLSALDEQVIADGRIVTVTEKIFLQSRLFYLRISRIPFRDSDGKISGILCVYRDITDIIEAQERSRQATQNTVQALVKTVEMRDEFLSGHSSFMSEISEALSRQMHLGDDVAETVSIAANLSQIGKMFIDIDLLTKPGKLSDEEMRAMEQHVIHASDILRDIDFDLPIHDAVYQMNERCDGSGYPQGITCEETCIEARILAVTNTFCAMIRPRSYRGALPPEKALEIIENEKDHYDPEVIAALRELLESSRGEALLKQFA